MINISQNGLSLYILKKDDIKNIFAAENGLNFHPSIVSELKRPTLHPKIDQYDSQAFIALRLPQFDRRKKHISASEIDFIIESDRLTLVQYGDLEPLDVLIEKIQKDPDEQSALFQINAGYMLYKIMDHLFRSLHGQLDHITHKVDEVDNKIFHGDEEKMVRLISQYRREAIDFRRIIKPNAGIFEDLTKTISNIFDKETSVYFNNVGTVAARLTHFIENHIETLAVIHETNETLLTNKTNKIMRLLTIFAVTVFPLTLFSSIWGMNTGGLPLVDHPQGFWILLGIMALSALSMLTFFKFKKWL